jgi:co-chaperonin GroES (HSP10)
VTQALRVQHDKDPKLEIQERCNELLKGITLLGTQILVAIYRRPDKTKGGLYLADTTRKEDVYQGKVGLILKMGPLAFVSDDRNTFLPPNPAVGDWIAFRVGDTWQCTLNDQPCRMVEDVDVRMIVTEPDMLY